jgi:hypothetical protein
VPAAFEDSLILGDREQGSSWSVVSELVSLIDRTRTHRQPRDLVKQIDGTTETSVGAMYPPRFGPTQIPASVAWSDCNQRLRDALFFCSSATRLATRTSFEATEGCSLSSPAYSGRE